MGALIFLERRIHFTKWNNGRGFNVICFVRGYSVDSEDEVFFFEILFFSFSLNSLFYFLIYFIFIDFFGYFRGLRGMMGVVLTELSALILSWF